jgi:hypothetical protein
MVGNGILNHFDEFLLGRCRADLMSMQKLHHQTRESFECSRDADGRANSDEHILGRVYVDLQLAGLVDRRIEERKETLYRHVSR